MTPIRWIAAALASASIVAVAAPQPQPPKNQAKKQDFIALCKRDPVCLARYAKRHRETTPPYASGIVDAAQLAQHPTVRFLRENGLAIRRSITWRGDGYEMLVESDDPGVAARIRAHFLGEAARFAIAIEPLADDPLFTELFWYADRIDTEVWKTSRGATIIQRSDDAYVAQLLQLEGDVIDRAASIPEGEASIPLRPVR